MTREEFLELGEKISRKAGVFEGNGLHGYFLQHATRLWEVMNQFGLLSRDLGDVMEIGPFYGYVPFVLRPRSTSFIALEGDDPAVYPLLPVYEENKITCSRVDLFEMFGPTHGATHKLPFADASFDTILCWETMEHFGFNPVKFVRELHRILKPGGRAYVTVPNRASFQNLVGLMTGRGEKYNIDAYFTFEDYESNGKKAFYGFHWREYSPTELAAVFDRAGFKIRQGGTFVAFQDHEEKLSAGRSFARSLSRTASRLLPRFGTHVGLIAEK